MRPHDEQDPQGDELVLEEQGTGLLPEEGEVPVEVEDPDAMEESPEGVQHPDDLPPEELDAIQEAQARPGAPGEDAEVG